MTNNDKIFCRVAIGVAICTALGYLFSCTPKTEEHPISCPEHCERIIKDLESESQEGWKVWYRRLEVCKRSCNHMGDIDGGIPPVISYTEQESRERCSAFCNRGEPCPSAARCYEARLAAFASAFPSSHWYFRHNLGSTICHEEKCVNEDCSSLFSKTTFRQRSVSDSDSDVAKGCENCYESCEVTGTD